MPSYSTHNEHSAYTQAAQTGQLTNSGLIDDQLAAQAGRQAYLNNQAAAGMFTPPSASATVASTPIGGGGGDSGRSGSGSGGGSGIHISRLPCPTILLGAMVAPIYPVAAAVAVGATYAAARVRTVVLARHLVPSYEAEIRAVPRHWPLLLVALVTLRLAIPLDMRLGLRIAVYRWVRQLYRITAFGLFAGVCTAAYLHGPLIRVSSESTGALVWRRITQDSLPVGIAIGAALSSGLLLRFAVHRRSTLYGTFKVDRTKKAAPTLSLSVDRSQDKTNSELRRRFAEVKNRRLEQSKNAKGENRE